MCQENTPHTITPLHHQSEPLREAGWIFLISYKSPQSDENEKCNKSVLCVSSRGQSQLSLSLSLSGLSAAAEGGGATGGEGL